MKKKIFYAGLRFWLWLMNGAIVEVVNETTVDIAAGGYNNMLYGLAGPMKLRHRDIFIYIGDQWKGVSLPGVPGKRLTHADVEKLITKKKAATIVKRKKTKTAKN